MKKETDMEMETEKETDTETETPFSSSVFFGQFWCENQATAEMSKNLRCF